MVRRVSRLRASGKWCSWLREQPIHKPGVAPARENQVRVKLLEHGVQTAEQGACRVERHAVTLLVELDFKMMRRGMLRVAIGLKMKYAQGRRSGKELPGGIEDLQGEQIVFFGAGDTAKGERKGVETGSMTQGELYVYIVVSEDGKGLGGCVK